MRQIQGVALASLASAVFGGLVLASGGPLLPRGSQVAATDLARPVLAVVVGMVFFLAIICLAISCLGRRRTRPTPSAPVDLQGDAVDAIDVRVLHAQIRSLEEALEQEHDLVREPVLTAETAMDDAVEEVLGRIQATVRGLGVRMQDDPVAAEVMARVEAAAQRLTAPAAAFARPTLAGVRRVAMPMTAALPSPAAVPVREVTAEGVGDEAPTLEIAYVAPVLAPPVEAEVVLPIPARTPGPEIRRGRRWLRRNAA